VEVEMVEQGLPLQEVLESQAQAEKAAEERF